MKRLGPALAVILAGCAPSSPPAPAAEQPKLDLVRFFTGTSEGRGTIDVIFQSAEPLRVTSRGRPGGAGRLILDQRITEGAKPARQRRWLMHCTAGGRCDGSLSDASGPVSVAVQAMRRSPYAMKHGLAVEHWLVLRPDRRTIDNRLRVRKWGVTVARIDEVIRKRD